MTARETPTAYAGRWARILAILLCLCWLAPGAAAGAPDSADAQAFGLTSGDRAAASLPGATELARGLPARSAARESRPRLGASSGTSLWPGVAALGAPRASVQTDSVQKEVQKDSAQKDSGERDNVVSAAAPGQVTAAAAAGDGSGAVTKPGTGEFAGMKLTVSKTENLTDETVRINWTGALPTNSASSGGSIGRPPANDDYLQIMQCWGDEPTGPTPEHCQFGAFSDSRITPPPSAVTALGYYPPSRVITPHLNSPYPIDPLAKDDLPGGIVPFESVRKDDQGKNQVWPAPDDKKGVSQNPFFDSYTTNEITYAVTGPAGTGQTFMEIQTGVEASALGCGYVNGGRPRPCWLVVVPRGATDVDGKPIRQIFDSPPRLASSPLSPSNWKNRIVFSLNFLPVGLNCPLSAQPYPIVGSESGAQAITSWQPALCQNGGPAFSFNKVPEAATENKVLRGGDPGLGFVSGPFDPGNVPPDRELVYAPMTLSGMAIGFVLDNELPPGAPAAEQATFGQPLDDIKLTPRLVAKLLTQSYIQGVDNATPFLNAGSSEPAGYLRGNPVTIMRDPEFQQINPGLKDVISKQVEMLVTADDTKTNGLLWRWLATDQDTVDFVNGLPDPWGMRVNPFYQGLDLARQSFPKNDPWCLRVQKNPAHNASDSTADVPPLCSQDMHPFADDMQMVARSAARGDILAKNQYSSTSLTHYGKWPLQDLARRALSGYTDSSYAARYKVVTAKLRNASGAFVAPTGESLLAGYGAMRPGSVPAVLQSTPGAKDPDAYPLSAVTYAVTSPNKLSAVEAKTYADFVRYAVTSGQTPGLEAGMLPEGYQPLPYALRQQALQAADAIQARKGPPADPPASTPSSTTPPDTTPPSGDDEGTGGGPAGDGDGSGLTPSATAPPAGALPGGLTPTSSSFRPTNPAAHPAAATRRTPEDLIGLARYAVVGALLLGLVGSVLGPILPRLFGR